MSQEFAQKLINAGTDRKALTSIINDIDAQRRSIKSRLSQLSSEPDSQFAKGKERQVLIRRMVTIQRKNA